MSGKNKSEKLFDRTVVRCKSGIRISLCLLILVSCAVHKQLKATVPGEAIDIKASYVQSICIERDMKDNRLIMINMSQEGNDVLYQFYSRHIGQDLSLFFGDRNIVPNLRIIEAAKVSGFYFPIENEKDEALALDLMKTYPGFKKSK